MSLPIEIAGLLRQNVTITWDDDHVSVYPSRDLRLHCRCAECVHEWSGQPLLDPSKLPERLTVKHIEIVGQYAVRFEFSDGHGLGIYRFRDLRERCPCEACVATLAARPPAPAPSVGIPINRKPNP